MKYRSNETFYSGKKYMALTAIGVIPVMILGIAAIDSFTTMKRIEAPYVPESNYIDVAIANSAGAEWGKSFVKDPITNVAAWRVSETNENRQPIDFSECDSFGLLPETLQSTHRAESDDIRLTVQVYSPGQAKQEYLNYKEKYKRCFNIQPITSQTSVPTEVLKDSTNFFFSFGDAIIFVRNKPAIDQNSLLFQAVEKAASTLKSSGCAALNTSEKDKTRNFYSDPKTFTGFLKTEVINTNIELGNIPNAVYTDVDALNTMKQPEGPLSPNIPQLSKEIAERPSVPKTPDEQDLKFDKSITYQITDPVGPGCGWAWAAQKAPFSDDDSLKKAEESLRQKTQAELDAVAQKYVNDKLAYTKSLLLVMSSIEDWNLYVKDVEAVFAKWDWLNKERAKVRGPWFKYVEDYNSWQNFDSRKASAQTDYDKKVEQCTAANAAVEKWESEWRAEYDRQQRERNAPRPTPTPTPTPTPSPEPTGSPTETPAPTPTIVPQQFQEPNPQPTVNIPPRPQGCTRPPAEPKLLTQEKGAEPQAPKLPEDVTIPASWPKPRA